MIKYTLLCLFVIVNTQRQQVPLFIEEYSKLSIKNRIIMYKFFIQLCRGDGNPGNYCIYHYEMGTYRPTKLISSDIARLIYLDISSLFSINRSFESHISGSAVECATLYDDEVLDSTITDLLKKLKVTKHDYSKFIRKGFFIDNYNIFNKKNESFFINIKLNKKSKYYKYFSLSHKQRLHEKYSDSTPYKKSDIKAIRRCKYFP